MKSIKKEIEDFHIEKNYNYNYKNLYGRAFSKRDIFFKPLPNICKEVIWADTTMHEDHIDEIFWDKLSLTNYIFYNTFFCKNAVVQYTYDKKSKKLIEEIVSFEDEDFLKHIATFQENFYQILLEKFLKEAKEKIKNNKTVKLYFIDNDKEYKIILAKKYFAIYEDGKLKVENYLERIKCTYLGSIIFNQYTNKKVSFKASAEVCKFFKFYLQIWYKNNKEREKVGDFLTSLKAFIGDFLPLIFFVVFSFIFMYIDIIFSGGFYHKVTVAIAASLLSFIIHEIFFC